MKKLFALLVLGLTVPAVAEIVSTVSFNPSRIGEYTQLKISRDANFKGGLDATTMNVNTGGTVTMQWDGNTGNKYYDAQTVKGGTNTTVEMEQTTFWNGDITATPPNYSAANATAPAGVGPNIAMDGGVLEFVSTATNNDSYVSKLEQTGAGKLQHYTTNLTEGTLKITGLAGSSIGLTENGTSRDGLQTLGFHLAGVDIPHPTGHTVNKTTSGTANNATLAITNSGCGLEWVKRTAEVTENSKTVNKEVYVLAFAGCTANGGSEEITPRDTYYFKCVSRITSNELIAMGNYSSFAAAQAACVSGEDPSAEYDKYLTGGGEDPNCRAPVGQSCPLLPAYYIKYRCSTEAPKPANGYGFDETLCVVIVPHE